MKMSHEWINFKRFFILYFSFQFISFFLRPQNLYQQTQRYWSFKQTNKLK